MEIVKMCSSAILQKRKMLYKNCGKAQVKMMQACAIPVGRKRWGIDQVDPPFTHSLTARQWGLEGERECKIGDSKRDFYFVLK